MLLALISSNLKLIEHTSLSIILRMLFLLFTLMAILQKKWQRVFRLCGDPSAINPFVVLCKLILNPHIILSCRIIIIFLILLSYNSIQKSKETFFYKSSAGDLLAFWYWQGWYTCNYSISSVNGNSRILFEPSTDP